MSRYNQLKNLFNLNERDFTVINYLIKNRRDNAKGIAYSTGVDIPRVYESLKRLEKMDLVVKEGDWSAYYRIDSCLVEKIIKAFHDRETDRFKQIQELNQMIKEISRLINPESVFKINSSIELLKPPFTTIYSVEKDPRQFIDFYSSWANSIEINLVQTPNQFLQAIQRYHSLDIEVKKRMAKLTETIKQFRVIITGDFDISSLKIFVENKEDNYIDFLGSKNKIITVRKLNLDKVKFLHGVSDEMVYFPICRPDDSLISIIGSRDWSLIEIFRSFFWDNWRKAKPQFQLEKNKLILLE